jgi:predicted aspartyl protease
MLPLLLLAHSFQVNPNVVATVPHGIGSSVAIQRLENYLMVKAKVNGKDLNLIIDSGAGLSAMTPEAAKRCGVTGGVEIKGTGAGKGSVPAKVVSVEEFSLGEAVVKNDLFVVIDLPAILKCDGLVGYSFLRHFATTVDYDQNALIVQSVKDYKPEPEQVAVTMRVQGNHPHVKGSVDGKDGWFLIDTGNGGGTIFYKWFSDKNNLAKKWESGAPEITGKGVGGLVIGRTTRAPSFQLGSVKMPSGVATLDSDGEAIFANTSVIANVGGEMLRRFTFTLDYINKKAYFKPSKQYFDSFIRDRSGLLLDYENGKFRVVGIRPKSPAEQSGFTIGDVVTSINGTSVNTIHPLLARIPLRGNPGVTVEIEGYRKEVFFRSVITLAEPQI